MRKSHIQRQGPADGLFFLLFSAFIFLHGLTILHFYPILLKFTLIFRLLSLSLIHISLRTDSHRYLRERIDRAMDFIKNGDNLGQALSKSKLNFPDKEIVADLRIYAELDNFEEALDRLANDWLDESAEAVEQKASILNMVAMFAISGIIAWAVFGVFEMQDQIRCV